VWGHGKQILPLVDDAAAIGRQQPRQGIQHRRLAGAVGANQGDDLPFVYLKRDAVNGFDAAVGDFQVFDAE
jgi:hypothetical protein